MVLLGKYPDVTWHLVPSDNPRTSSMQIVDESLLIYKVFHQGRVHPPKTINPYSDSTFQHLPLLNTSAYWTQGWIANRLLGDVDPVAQYDCD